MLVYELINNQTEYKVVNETDKTLEKIEIPNTYNGLPVTEISGTFSGHPNLKELYIGNNVKKTGYGTFDSTTIEKIYFGKSIEYITGPFNMMTNLKHLYYSGTEEEWQNVYFAIIDETDSLEYIENAEKHFGVLGNAVFLKKEDKFIFPYTHWDCVAGKPDRTSAERIGYDNLVSGLNADNVKSAIDELCSKHFDLNSIGSWKDFKYFVRTGRAKELLNIGDQLVTSKGDEEIVWEVIGIDKDIPDDEKLTHSITLQTRDCVAYLPFSSVNASFYAVRPVTAGQYYISLKYYKKDPTYFSFTLEEDLPEGNLLRICEDTVYLYSSRRGDAYKTFPIDSKSDNPDEAVGTRLSTSGYYTDSLMGTVNYKSSDIRMWLNGTGYDWINTESMCSMRDSNYDKVPAFLTDMDEDFLDAVNCVEKVSKLPDGTTVVTKDKFFLLSQEEIFAKSKAENAYQYYRENSAYSTPNMLEDAVRIKTYNAEATHWWLRDAGINEGCLLRSMPTGAVSAAKLNGVVLHGIAPACVIY